jgi:hypothetical protein
MRGPAFVLAAVLSFVLLAEDAASLRFEVRVAGAAPATVKLRATSVANPSASSVIEVVDGRGALSVAIGSEWDVSSGDDAFWMAPRRITAAEGTIVALVLWPTARIKGRLVVPEGEKKPDTVSFVVETLPAQTADIPRGTKFECPADTSGGFLCTLPAAARHVVLRIPAMTPHYFWEIGLKPGQTRDLGNIALKRGASFTAYLERDVAQTLKAPARARIVRPVAAVPSETAARLSVPVAEAEFDRRGFVQLAPLPAGTYNVEIRAKDFATRVIGPLEIYEGKETSFRKAIELFPPLQVRIAIAPPQDADARPWSIRWNRVADFAPAEAGVRLHSDPDGQAVIADQSPGLYSLKIADAEGNQLWQQDVRVEAGDISIPVALDLHVASGTVKLGDAPIEATLWFGTRHGVVHARAMADAEGAFQVRLPRLGEWPVEVVDDARGIHSIVSVSVAGSKPIAVELPDTSLSGWVIDHDGQRLTSGRVMAASSARAFTTTLNAAGEFTLRGLQEGSVQLLANNATGESSAPLALQVKSGAPLRHVELRILKTRRVAGLVFSAGQHLAGARVSVVPQVPRGGQVAQAVTDAGGRFEVRMPEETTRVVVVIGAPNRTLHTFEVPVSAEVPQYDVAPAGGTLELRFSRSRAPWMLTRDGVPVPVTFLLDWIVSHGIPLDDESRLRVPDLAPGQYRACNGAAQCVSGALAPGATLQLTVPD